MPSKSKAQQRLMRAAAHTPGGYGGVPQSVGAEFEAADEASPARRLPARVKAPLTRNQAVAAIRKKGPRMGQT
jgi:hypothetical protein